MSELQFTPPHIADAVKQVLHATARQRELMLPDPVGVVLPAGKGFADLTYLAGLPVVRLDTETFGLIIPMERS